MSKSKQRNPSIDVFRYICAILVIAIHTGPFKEINESLGFIVTDIIPRVAVPFFFIVSGYFYVCKLQNGEKPLWNSIKRLLIVYSLWSIFYYLIQYIQWGYYNPKGFAINCVVSFIFYGSSYHFWFFPALIFALCFTTLLWKMRYQKIIIPLSIILYIIGVLGCAYYNLCRGLPLLSKLFEHELFTAIRRILLMGFPFFAGGYLVLSVENVINKRQSLLMWIVSLTVWIIEIVIVIQNRYQRNVIITFGLYPFVIFTFIVLLKNPLQRFVSIAGTCRQLANFAYYSHPALIMVIEVLINRISSTGMFLLVTVASTALGLVICKCNNPLLNELIR